jgi:hypothetical protein
MELIDTFSFNAPAEIVYNGLTDPDRAHRWLPAGMQIAERDGRHVGLRAGDRRIDLEVSMAPDDMLLTVRCTEPVRLEGTAQVKETSVGGSQVDLVVTTDRTGPDPATVRRVVDQTMRHLQRDIDDNFTPG